jgi:hypothetical protein
MRFSNAAADLLSSFTATIVPSGMSHGPPNTSCGPSLSEDVELYAEEAVVDDADAEDEAEDVESSDRSDRSVSESRASHFL